MWRVTAIRQLLRLTAQNPAEAKYFFSALLALHPARGPLAAERPFIPFTAIKWLERTLTSTMRVFEYGSGGSTLFFARKVRHVVSVEHDEPWYTLVIDALSAAGLGNVELLLRPAGHSRQSCPDRGRIIVSSHGRWTDMSFENYVYAIDAIEDQTLDLVFVDGRARSACTQRALQKIRPGGWLVLDDSQRQKYREGISALQGYVRKDFFGLVRGKLETHQTSAWHIK
jgi:predicted O-methyltransferase YrrM